MSFHFIDMEKYPRKSHFSYFDSMMYPYVGVTSEVDITSFLSYIKEKELPFFSYLLLLCGKGGKSDKGIQTANSKSSNYRV